MRKFGLLSNNRHGIVQIFSQWKSILPILLVRPTLLGQLQQLSRAVKGDDPFPWFFGEERGAFLLHCIEMIGA